TEGQYKLAKNSRPIRHGIGKYQKPNGVVYSGHWEENTLSGPICYVKLPAEKVEYKGEMLNGQYHGTGEYSCPEYYYAGAFINGKYDLVLQNLLKDN
ncbi:hypothetical protein BV898_20324, partial [Hypsibius exemplaris]